MSSNKVGRITWRFWKSGAFMESGEKNTYSFVRCKTSIKKPPNHWYTNAVKGAHKGISQLLQTDRKENK